MMEDWFQERKTDLFQSEYAPGRVIPDEVRQDAERKLSEIFGIPEDYIRQPPRYCKDERNRSGWITVVYRSMHEAQNAAGKLPDSGLNVFYPLTRYRCTQIEMYLQSLKGLADTQSTRFVPAFGRYLLVQLPEDQETFENLDVSQTWLEGPFNKNGVVTILSHDGEYSVTPNEEILRCRRFHDNRNKKTDPAKVLRFRADEMVRVTDGNLVNWNVRIVDDVPLAYKIASKVAVYVGNGGAIHQVRIAWLEKC